MALPRELFQRGPIAHRPTMTKGIGKASLTMGTPLRVVVSCLFHIGRAGLHSALYELIGSGDENLDPSGCEACLSRAQLLPLTRHSFVEKECRATELKPSNAAQSTVVRRQALSCTTSPQHQRRTRSTSQRGLVAHPSCP